VGCGNVERAPAPELRGNALVLRSRELSQDLSPDAQAELLIHLRRASAFDYDRVLAALDLDEVLDELTDAGWDEGPSGELLELLSVTRVVDAEPPTRARLVHGFMRGATFEREEQALVSIFRETPDNQLTALKLAVDAGYPRDLVSLVHDDLDDEALRAELIARCQAATGPGRIVLSDVDDTLFPSLNDPRYPDDRLYPGVRALLEALASGQPAVVALLTARPGPLGAYTVRSLAEQGVPVSLALTGTLAGIRSHGAMAANKVEAFLRYKALYPNLRAVFCGDTGQGDPEVALALLDQGALDLALLHAVGGLEPGEREALEARGVIVFETYLGAALALERAGWLEPGELLSIARFAVAELKPIVFEDDAPIAAHWSRDVAAVEEQLGVELVER